MRFIHQFLQIKYALLGNQNAFVFQLTHLERKFRKIFFEEKLVQESCSETGKTENTVSVDPKTKTDETGSSSVYLLCSNIIYESLLFTPFVITQSVVLLYLVSYENSGPIQSTFFMTICEKTAILCTFSLLFVVLSAFSVRLLMIFLPNQYDEVDMLRSTSNYFSIIWWRSKCEKIFHSFNGYHFYTSICLTFSLFVSSYFLFTANDKVFEQIDFLSPKFYQVFYLLNIFFILIFTRAMTLSKFLIVMIFAIANFVFSVISKPSFRIEPSGNGSNSDITNSTSMNFINSSNFSLDGAENLNVFDSLSTAALLSQRKSLTLVLSSLSLPDQKQL